MLIVTNFERFPKSWTADDGTEGRSVEANEPREYREYLHRPDAVFIVNCDPRLVLELVAQQIRYQKRRPIVAVDLVLRRPKTVRDRAAIAAKRHLFKRVDHFIHYFKDVSGLEKIYNISSARSSFVDFKSNLWEQRAKEPRPDGDYALCFGRSLRDYDTFLAAMERCDVPGGIVDPRVGDVRRHGSRFSRPLSALPKNVQLLPDDMTAESQVRLIQGAASVVVPIVKGSLVASGISTILNAMALGKCVIASEGPGISDVFDDELLTVPLEDPDALARVMQRAWLDHALRRRTARAGWEYAMRCGGERDFHQRVIDAVLRRRESLNLAPAPTER